MTAPANILPASAVIATRNRPAAFRRTLASLAEQSAQPAELVIVDASDDAATEAICREPIAGLRSDVRWFRAKTRGAAVQRNEAMALARPNPVIWFHDDDVIFEPECVARLWAALQSNPRIGGAGTTITNQKYHEPGPVFRMVFAILAGHGMPSYAGRILGPGLNVFPDDNDALPEVVPVDWLNTTCTMYRREALPNPPFASHFTGYSLMEDVTLSLVVARNWKLVNARTARIFHDSQPGDHKRSRVGLSAMELVNRHYVMTQVLYRKTVADYLRLGVWESLQVASAARTGFRRLYQEAAGKLLGMYQLAFPKQGR